MKIKEDASSQKLRGGYYTPLELSNFIVKWGKRENIEILEPSCGDGSFLESINKEYLNTNYKCTAIELLEEELVKAKSVIKNSKKFDFLNQDFYDYYENHKNKKYDLIVGNPPYIRYQYLSQSQRDYQSQMLKQSGMKSNKLINSWVAFVVASVNLLKDKGKIGLVIPAELLQVAYAKDLRLFLTNNLSKITIVAFKELVFPEVQQEVILLMGEKDISQINEDKGEISFIETKNISSLSDISDEKIEYKHINHSTDKWTKYLLSNSEIELIAKAQDSKDLKYFDEIANVDVGITTGNNKYFSVDKNIVEEYNLKNVVNPLIGRSCHINGLFFDNDLWRENVEKNKRSFLINFPDIPLEEYEIEHKNYILNGENNNENSGYKCRIRKRWYRVPSIWMPQIFLLRRSNLYPKFILNELDAVSTDTMHRITTKGNLSPKILLLSYYNSITFASIELEARSYGGGVLEILPGEVKKILISDLSFITEEEAQIYLKKIDSMLKMDNDIEKVLDYVDRKIILKNFNFTEEDLINYRKIWRKLKDRRLNRK